MKMLKALRTKEGLNQKELGNIFNVSQNTVSQWENGTRKPDFNMISDIADYFHVPVDYLLGRATKSTQPDQGKSSELRPAKSVNVTQTEVDELEWALLDETKELTDDQKRAIIEMIKIMKK